MNTTGGGEKKLQFLAPIVFKMWYYKIQTANNRIQIPHFRVWVVDFIVKSGGLLFCQVTRHADRQLYTLCCRDQT